MAKIKVHVLRHYAFIDKDPVIDKMRTLMAEEGVSEYHAALMAGLSPGTVKNWISGPTRRPQFASIVSQTRALGYDMEFKRRRNVDVEGELKKAAEEKKANGKATGKIREFRW
jgi:hypothetical protein